MRNNYPRTVSIILASADRPDTPAIIGTDGITFIDGRWNNDTATNHVYERVASYLTRGYKILGYMPLGLGDYSEKIYPLP